MAKKNKNLGLSGQKAKKPDQRALVTMTIRDLKIMAMNDKGKLRYIKGLDFMLSEMYGVKKIASKLICGKQKDIGNLRKKIDLTGLIKLLCDREAKSVLRTAIIIYHKVAEDNSLTEKEIKKHLKKCKKTAEILRKDFKITKFKNEDDVSIKDLERYIENNEEYYDDYFDFGYDDDDDDYDAYTSNVPASNLEKYLESFGGKSSKSRNVFDDDDDYDYDDYADYDDDDEDEGENEIAEGFKQIGVALNGIMDRIEAIESRQYAPQQAQPCNHNHKPPQAVDKNMSAIIGSINNLNKVITTNTQSIGQIANSVDAIGETVDILNEEMSQVTGRVNHLTSGFNAIIKDLYDEDPDGDIEIDDEDDGDIIIRHNAGDVTIGDITDAMTDPSDDLVAVPGENVSEAVPVQPTKVYPTPIKDM